MFFAFNNVMMRIKGLGCPYSFDQKAIAAVQVAEWRLAKVSKRAAVEQGNDRTAIGPWYLSWFLTCHILFVNSSLEIRI